MAREALAKVCSLDLHPRRFGPGRCAQTLLARCGAILHQLDDAPSYDLLPRRSYAEYLWMLLTDAIAEFGGRAVAAPTALAERETVAKPSSDDAFRRAAATRSRQS